MLNTSIMAIQATPTKTTDMDTSKQLEFVALVQEHRSIVAKVCVKYCPNNMTPDELIDEVIAEAWEGWVRFRGDSKPSTWLHAVARNVSIDRLRRFMSGTKVILVDPLEFPFFPIKDEYYADSKVTALREGRAHKMLEVLSDKERELVLLYAEGKSYKEMEVITGYNQNRLRVRIKRIRDRLKEAFPDYR